jgi:hypothetical protein
MIVRVLKAKKPHAQKSMGYPPSNQALSTTLFWLPTW